MHLLDMSQLISLLSEVASSNSDKDGDTCSVKRTHSNDETKKEHEAEEPPPKIAKSSEINKSESSSTKEIFSDISEIAKLYDKGITTPGTRNTNSDKKKNINDDNKISNVPVSVNGLSVTQDLTNALQLQAPPIEDEFVDIITIDDDTSAECFERIFDKCEICKSCLSNRNPLLLGCLHSFCSECLLRKKHFHLGSATLKSAEVSGY